MSHIPMAFQARALNRAQSFRKRALYVSAKEPYYSAKEPDISAKEPYISEA